jgi:hypothetical protein
MTTPNTPQTSEDRLREAIRNAMQCDDAAHLADPTGEACFECQVDKVMQAVKAEIGTATTQARIDEHRQTSRMLRVPHEIRGVEYYPLDKRWWDTRLEHINAGNINDELVELRKSFVDSKKYTGVMVKQVIDARLRNHFGIGEDV